MTDKTHQIIGLGAATAGFLIMHPQDPVTRAIAGTILIGSFLGSIMPDIDQPTSGFWEAIPLGDWVGKIAVRFMGGHRNLSHSILGVVLFGLLFRWLSTLIPPNWFLSPQIFYESFVIGFIAHLAADGITVMGIPLLWPWGDYMGFPPYPLHGMRIVTGKWFENLIVLPATVLLLVALVLNQAPRFCQVLINMCR